MTIFMCSLYVGFDRTYIGINTCVQGIKSFLTSQSWSQVIAGARTYVTELPAIPSQP